MTYGAQDNGMAENKLKTLTLDELLAHPFPQREHLVFPWLRQGESALIWAAPGIGKTMLSLTLALAVAGGGSVLGWESTAPRSVLYVDGEMNAADLRDRLEMLAGTVEDLDMAAARRNLRVLSRQFQGGEVTFPDLAEDQAPDGANRLPGQEVVLREARRHKAELVIIDNLTTCAGVDDENAAASMAPVIQFLLKIKQAGHGCILVHHSDKGGNNFRGSSAIATTFEVILGLRRLESHEAGAGAAFELDWTKYRGRPTAATRAAEVRLVREPPQWTSKPASKAELEALLEAARSCQFATQRALADHLGWDTGKVSRLKHRAIRESKISAAEWKEALSGTPKVDPEAGEENQDF